MPMKPSASLICTDFLAARRLAFLSVFAFAAIGSLFYGSMPSAVAQEGVQTLIVSPSGMGDRSGSDRTNAMPFVDALPIMAAGERELRVTLLAGEYAVPGKFVIRLAARRGSGAPLLLEGEGPATRFTGEYRFGDEPARPLFMLGRSNVTLANFAVRNVGKFVEVPNGADTRNIQLRDIQVQNVHDGIMLDRRRRFVAQDWRIEDVSIIAYERTGIRLSGKGTSRFSLKRIRLDGSGTEGHDNCHKGGLQLFEHVSDVVVDGMTVTNNVGCPAHYQQGDGIEADNKQGAPRRITLRNIEATGNRDGNFDLKAIDVKMENLTSRGQGVSRFGFRMWNYTYTCIRCSNAGSEFDTSIRNADVSFIDAQFENPEPRWRCSEEQGRKREVLRLVRSGQTTAETDCAIPGPPGSPSAPRPPREN